LHFQFESLVGTETASLSKATTEEPLDSVDESKSESGEAKSAADPSAKQSDELHLARSASDLRGYRCFLLKIA